MIPAFRPGVRLHWDRVRARFVLLAPERVVELDETAKAILDRVDGQASLGEIAQALAVEYEADPTDIEADAQELLRDLNAKGYVSL